MLLSLPRVERDGAIEIFNELSEEHPILAWTLVDGKGNVEYDSALQEGRRYKARDLVEAVRGANIHDLESMLSRMDDSDVHEYQRITNQIQEITPAQWEVLNGKTAMSLRNFS